MSGIRLSFWDLGGQQELQSLWDKYYQESHAIIYVVDSHDRERMEESKAVFGLLTFFNHFQFLLNLPKTMKFLIFSDKMICNEHLAGIPLLLLANKQDLPDCMGVREIKPVFQQSAIHIGRRDCLVMPVSALTGEGVQEGIQWLVEAILRSSLIRPPRMKD